MEKIGVTELSVLGKRGKREDYNLFHETEENEILGKDDGEKRKPGLLSPGPFTNLLCFQQQERKAKKGNRRD